MYILIYIRFVFVGFIPVLHHVCSFVCMLDSNSRENLFISLAVQYFRFVWCSCCYEHEKILSHDLLRSFCRLENSRDFFLPSLNPLARFALYRIYFMCSFQTVGRVTRAGFIARTDRTYKRKN